MYCKSRQHASHLAPGVIRASNSSCVSTIDLQRKAVCSWNQWCRRYDEGAINARVSSRALAFKAPLAKIAVRMLDNRTKVLYSQVTLQNGGLNLINMNREPPLVAAGFLQVEMSWIEWNYCRAHLRYYGHLFFVESFWIWQARNRAHTTSQRPWARQKLWGIFVHVG